MRLIKYPADWRECRVGDYYLQDHLYLLLCRSTHDSWDWNCVDQNALSRDLSAYHDDKDRAATRFDNPDAGTW